MVTDWSCPLSFPLPLSFQKLFISSSSATSLLWSGCSQPKFCKKWKPLDLQVLNILQNYNCRTLQMKWMKLHDSYRLWHIAHKPPFLLLAFWDSPHLETQPSCDTDCNEQFASEVVYTHTLKKKPNSRKADKQTTSNGWLRSFIARLLIAVSAACKHSWSMLWPAASASLYDLSIADNRCRHPASRNTSCKQTETVSEQTASTKKKIPSAVQM